MAYNSEIIAILSSGVSFHRLIRPYMVGAAIIAIFSYLLGDYIIPPANKEMVEFKNTVITSYSIHYTKLYETPITHQSLDSRYNHATFGYHPAS